MKSHHVGDDVRGLVHERPVIVEGSHPSAGDAAHLDDAVRFQRGNQLFFDVLQRAVFVLRGHTVLVRLSQRHRNRVSGRFLGHWRSRLECQIHGNRYRSSLHAREVRRPISHIDPCFSRRKAFCLREGFHARNASFRSTSCIVVCLRQPSWSLSPPHRRLRRSPWAPARPISTHRRQWAAKSSTSALPMRSRRGPSCCISIRPPLPRGAPSKRTRLRRRWISSKRCTPRSSASRTTTSTR